MWRGVSPKDPPPVSTDARGTGELAKNPEIPPHPLGGTIEDVLAVFPGAQVISEGQPAVWPPAEIVQPTADTLVLLARAKGLPCAPLAPGVTIVGTDWAWQAFAATASPADRAAARAYLEQLDGTREPGEDDGDEDGECLG
jgi:hypothetical protein